MKDIIREDVSRTCTTQAPLFINVIQLQLLCSFCTGQSIGHEELTLSHRSLVSLFQFNNIHLNNVAHYGQKETKTTLLFCFYNQQIKEEHGATDAETDIHNRQLHFKLHRYCQDYSYIIQHYTTVH